MFIMKSYEVGPPRWLLGEFGGWESAGDGLTVGRVSEPCSRVRGEDCRNGVRAVQEEESRQALTCSSPEWLEPWVPKGDKQVKILEEETKAWLGQLDPSSCHAHDTPAVEFPTCGSPYLLVS